MMVIVLGLSIPFGYLAGWMSEIDRRYPFALICVFMVVKLVIIAASKKRLEAVKDRVLSESEV